MSPGAPDPAALAALGEEIAACRRCPRLVAWREEAARVKVARFAADTYWGRPVPGFGDPAARVVLVGLAPAANGANRTGRVFTGDRSGDFLWPAMHAAGLANQPVGRSRDDGLALRGAYVAAAVRCAPPANRPEPAEREACLPFLVRELALLPELRVLVALGGFAWDAVLRTLEAGGAAAPAPRPRFAHGAEAAVGGFLLVGTYHPSQQNTFTGRLTPPMLEAVLRRAATLAGLPGTPAPDARAEPAPDLR